MLALILTGVLVSPLGPVPPVLPLLNPATGIWSEVGQAGLPMSGAIRIPGLKDPVQVTYSAGGVPHIFARNDHDLFFAQGYLVARDRLFEMDLMRRQAEGRLAQVLGPKYVASDEAQLRMGLLVGARRTLSAMRTTVQGQKALSAVSAYSAGVNALIRQEEASGTLPMFFKLLGYRPNLWTPLDSILVQEDLEEVLAFSDAPLQLAVLARHLGLKRALSLIPDIPPNPQVPYDKGPYPSSTVTAAPLKPVSVQEGAAANRALSVVEAAKPIVPGLAQGFEESNNWAVSGALTATGKPILAGDPHLTLSLPSVWYEMQLTDPSYHVVGVNFPGAPGIVIGHNQSAAWSATDTESQATFFYTEKTSPAHPGEYDFKGAWYPFVKRTYSIPVKGHSDVSLTVDWTNNGPLLTSYGQHVAMDWTGDLASQDLTALLQMDRAKTLAAFERALSIWSCPVQNWVFADTAGDIAIMAPGLYPLVSHGNPALPLDGSGPDEWTGGIPASAQPKVVDPPSGVVVSANQRPVTAAYPYFIGDSLQFANGYRALTIHAFLTNPANRPFSVQSMEKLQADNQDALARLLAPYIAQTGKRLGLTGPVGQAVAAMASWNGVMSTTSVQATIENAFVTDYLKETFDPWFKAYHVPSSIPTDLVPLEEDIQVWTTRPTASTWFNDPLTGAHRTASEVMDTALKKALSSLTSKLGSNPARWTWARVHKRIFASLTGESALGRGPYGTGGDPNTPDAASPDLVATSGPSWRMIVSLGNLPSSVAIYPGGQSENPVSPFYADGLPIWLSYRYRPLVDLTMPQGSPLILEP